MTSDTERRCCHCRTVKPIAAFYRSSRGKKPYSRCADCDCEAKAISRAKHRGRPVPECKHNIPERIRLGDAVYRSRYYAKHRDRALAFSADWRRRNPIAMAWLKYQHSAKARDLVFDLDRPLFDDLITDRCFYCGSDPTPINGIDRMDSTLGYQFGNVVTCCRACNVAKWNRPRQEFEAWVRRVYARLPPVEVSA